MHKVDLGELEKDIREARHAAEGSKYGKVITALKAYYGAQEAAGRGYASLALQVIGNSGIDGQVANSVLQAVGGVAMGSRKYADLMVDLASRDLKTLEKNLKDTGSWPTMAQIEADHFAAYHHQNVPINAWGGSAFAYYGIDWSGGVMTPAEVGNGGHSLDFARHMTTAQVTQNALAVLASGMIRSENAASAAMPLADLTSAMDAHMTRAREDAIRNGVPSLAGVMDAAILVKDWVANSAPYAGTGARLGPKANDDGIGGGADVAPVAAAQDLGAAPARRRRAFR